MDRVLDLDKNVAQLCGEYPELKQIMSDLGFSDITKPLVLNTMGRMMTIPKGALMKEISLDHICETLKNHGFHVIHAPNQAEEAKVTGETMNTKDSADEENAKYTIHLTDKESLLKEYIERLTKGEDIELVKEEFRKNFSNVSAIEIAKAEQSILRDGTPLSDVQRLCDVHSALFHGATTAERIANAEKEVQRSAKEEKMEQMVSGFDQKVAKQMDIFMNEEGHPLQVLTLENHAIIKLTEEIERSYQEQNHILSILPQLKKLTTIAQHYGKKDELMLPLLKDGYGYPGPSDVMWGVEDEIRENLRQVIYEPEDVDSKEKLLLTLKRIREMIYKEENILFPLCVGNFTEDEWIAIARDLKMFGPCLISDIPSWDKVHHKKQTCGTENEKVILPGGSMNMTQLRAVLNTLPMEITVIDENDVNLFFNEGEKLFTRPTMAIGRKVYSCHPKRVEPMVRMLIHDFKTGKKDSMHILSVKCGKQVLINYYALRDDSGTYLGTLEAVQEIDGIADAIKNGKRGPISI